MYYISNLKTAAECRTVMQRARERNQSDVYQAVFRHLCELAGAGNDDRPIL